MRLIICTAIFLIAAYVGAVWALDIAISYDMRKAGIYESAGR